MAKFSTSSEVFKARSKSDNKFVAMKRVLMENEKEGVRFDELLNSSELIYSKTSFSFRLQHFVKSGFSNCSSMRMS
jgi:uncharacterized protein (DUF1919 family)